MTTTPAIRLVIGLGNPGKEYERTRHNVGFMVADELAARHHAEFRRKLRFNALFAEFELRPDASSLRRSTISLAKPQTFMNLSGESVQAIIHWLKLQPQEILILADDADLPLGTLRLRENGGSGGQKGLASIIQHLGADNFPRLRIGIGRPDPQKRDADLVGHVLSAFEKDELPLVTETILRAADAVECVLDKGVACAMNDYNKRSL